MRRVMILGSPGSGKSTLARRIGALCGLPVFHLDRFYHRPDWQSPPDELFAEHVAQTAALPAWVIDGNYTSTAASRLAAADTLIYLDVRRSLAMMRVIRRSLFEYGRQRSDTAEGCYERFDPPFLTYVWHWERDVAPEVRRLLDTFAGTKIVLGSRSASRRFVASL